MIDLTTIDPERLGQTQKAIREEIITRGWKASIPYVGSAHCFITRADGKELHIFSATPPTTTFAAANLANDKFATYQLLKDANVSQLPTIMVGSNDSLDEAEAFMHEQGVVVVKPVDGGHGKGITVNITTREQLEEAFIVGLKGTKNVTAVIVQKHYPHPAMYDLRIVTIDHKYAAGIQRVAARVFGDGQHTVGELIDIENRKENRGKAYKAQLATIDVDRAKLYLNERIWEIPADNEEVTVLGVANYGAGGETVDVTDDLPDWLIEEAERISRATGLFVAGVDFMLAKQPEKHMTREELDPAITEVNKCPLLTMHDTPTSGKNRHVTERYMDYLASL